MFSQAYIGWPCLIGRAGCHINSSDEKWKCEKSSDHLWKYESVIIWKSEMCESVKVSKCEKTTCENVTTISRDDLSLLWQTTSHYFSSLWVLQWKRDSSKDQMSSLWLTTADHWGPLLTRPPRDFKSTCCSTRHPALTAATFLNNRRDISNPLDYTMWAGLGEKVDALKLTQMYPHQDASDVQRLMHTISCKLRCACVIMPQLYRIDAQEAE